MKIFDFQKMKQAQEKISMITCYDYTSAVIVAQTSIDCVLVGDSAAMTMHGHKNTLAATLSLMCAHTSAVERGASNKFIISDLPFLSNRQSLSKNVAAVQALMQAGAHAVKLEGGAGNSDLINHLAHSGVPVMGHIGLTPQFIHMLGGYKVQGKNQDSAQKLKHEAALLQEAGCFALVLECVPAQLAKEISQSLLIPTIGIGAGPDTDGQVLVFQDLLGLNIDFKPKFSKAFVDGHLLFKDAIDSYSSAVKSKEFPANEHCYGH